MKVWKRNAVIAAVLLFVGVAVYLNWAYEKNAAQKQESEEASLISDTTLLDLEGDGASADESAGSGYVLSKAAREYFDSARITRQEGRDSALELLQEAAAFSETDEEVDYEAVSAHIQSLADYAMKEAQIDTLIMAKGFADCVTIMSEDALTVIVAAPEEGLSTEDVAKITDIATSESGYSAAVLKIIEVN
ncbi:MAG: SpoIIIAH-like family protein [Clostridiales bacterium]|jgi:stage III sporulation protein AH|nr:SpoIIIAH-like family protein [Clostridiales bacterium]